MANIRNYKLKKKLEEINKEKTELKKHPKLIKIINISTSHSL